MGSKLDTVEHECNVININISAIMHACCKLTGLFQPKPKTSHVENMSCLQCVIIAIPLMPKPKTLAYPRDAEMLSPLPKRCCRLPLIPKLKTHDLEMLMQVNCKHHSLTYMNYQQGLTCKMQNQLLTCSLVTPKGAL